MIGGAKNSARRRRVYLIRLIRAGFEPFRVRDIAPAFIKSPESLI